MRDVGLITCRELPEPDPDQALLLDALGAAGLDADLVAWDDPAAAPEAFGLCVLRSCWNYYEDAPAFLAWVDRVARSTRLANPADIVRGNVDKRYLHALEAAGVPVVPTLWVGAGESVDLEAIGAERGWDEVVIKPTVSAASFGTRRFRVAEGEAAARHVSEALAGRDVMIQPYMRSVESPGERALVWIDGALTHAVRKSPRFAGGIERVSAAPAVTDAEQELADRALAGIAARLLYARVDVVGDAGGRPVVAELELTEPSLFLAQHPPALERLVAAIARIRRDGG